MPAKPLLLPPTLNTGENIPDPKSEELVLDEIEIDLGMDDLEDEWVDEQSSEPKAPESEEDLETLSAKELTERCHAMPYIPCRAMRCALDYRPVP